ncbi:hypothetical protein ACS0TY_004036 [Phlomoides rotata]
MMFWSRLRQSRHSFYAFSNEFKRFYHLFSGPIVNQYISPRTVVPILNNPKFILQDSQLEFFHKVRFYAKRTKPLKKEKEEQFEPKINEQITAPFVRLVTEEGHDVVPLGRAMAQAESLGMDLVEVDKQSNPPVCKIFDVKKQKFVQRTMAKERAKSKVEIKKGSPKEVRFTAKIKQNDLKIKSDMAKRLMDSGYRVKCTATDPTADVDLKSLLARFCALIEDVAILETTPKFEKTQAYIVARHVKFGPSKKGPGKKASQDVLSSVTSEGTGETIEDVSESEDSHEDVQKKKSERAVFDGDDDEHNNFDSINEETYTIPSGIPKPAMENRYAKGPRSATPPRVPTERNGHDARNTWNSGPRFPGQGNQSRVGMDVSPQMRPNQVEAPGYGITKQDSSQSSNPKGFGIFSAQKTNTTPHEQNTPAVTNRYKVNAPTNSARNSRTGSPPHRDSRMNRGLGFDNPNKNENQAEIRR